jgi:hypothetical protein
MNISYWSIFTEVMVIVLLVISIVMFDKCRILCCSSIFNAIGAYKNEAKQ